MRKWTVLTAFAVLLSAAPAAAQTFGFGVHAGVSVPMGDYSDEPSANSPNSANLGFTGGVDLFYPIGMSGLNWLTSVSATAHGIDDEDLGNVDFDVDGGYLLFPVMTGVRFDIPAGGLSAFVQGQLGVVFAKGPEFEAGGETSDANFSTNFGFNLGGGLQMTENLYAGVRYFPLGDVDLGYEAPGGEVNVEQDISYLDVFVGFAVR